MLETWTGVTPRPDQVDGVGADDLTRTTSLSPSSTTIRRLR
jgi:hypothetical protein